MKFVHLTSKEFEIMKIFWQYDKPLTAAEIIDLSKEKTWSFNSLYPLLNKLLKNGKSKKIIEHNYKVTAAARHYKEMEYFM